MGVEVSSVAGYRFTIVGGEALISDPSRHSGAVVRYMGSKRPPRDKTWRHPSNRAIAVPPRAAAAIAVMEMGISDYNEIAEAVGLSVADVKRIDAAEDRCIRDLGILGIPDGFYFNLSKKVRCRKCYAWVTIAPCVACRCD